MTTPPFTAELAAERSRALLLAAEQARRATVARATATRPRPPRRARALRLRALAARPVRVAAARAGR